uniref:NADH-ubiquinone oxidoreductase chain 6 n=1 Tax=Anobiinae sp. GENSP01 TaxID=1205538 RepID=A0A0S2MN43_9COLE|nr:NADH deshydrogenase subunit 6 [Anobiinae sp. GENSP01]
MFIIMSTTITLSIMFVILTHPLIMVISLVMLSTLIAMITGIKSSSYWFSYMLFLIMVGGMLIVFIYMTSVASNEKIKVSFKSLTYMLMIIPTMFMMNFMMKNSMKMQKFNFKLQDMMMSKLLNMPNITLMMMMIIYLLVTLIATVKMTKLNQGPLRQKF